MDAEPIHRNGAFKALLADTSADAPEVMRAAFATAVASLARHQAWTRPLVLVLGPPAWRPANFHR